MVGCVIAKGEEIVAEGWHKQYGGPHAEPDALLKLSGSHPKESLTLYVNLEPCCHHGKTPPCADKIIASGIRKVVIGALDPNPLVAGRGVEKLKAAGVDVTVGVMESACLRLNKVFYVNQIYQRPYIYIKWAETADGYIAAKPFDPERKIISGKYAHIRAHQLRSECDALVVGAQTIRDDDPELTTRLWPGDNPDIYIYAPSGNISAQAKLFQANRPVYIMSRHATLDLVSRNISYQDQSPVAQSVVEAIREHSPHASSILVEGGAMLQQAFLNEGLYDEIICIRSKHKFMGQGIRAAQHALNLRLQDENEDDLIYTFQRYE